MMGLSLIAGISSQLDRCVTILTMLTVQMDTQQIPTTQHTQQHQPQPLLKDIVNLMLTALAAAAVTV